MGRLDLLDNTSTAQSLASDGDSSPPTAVLDSLSNLTSVRALAVPIHMNGNYKRCACDDGVVKETNYALREPMQDIIQLERFYSRRNR